MFQKCRTRGIPIFMVTSGGYTHKSARVVADSILNLRTLELISCPEAEEAPLIDMPGEALTAATNNTWSCGSCCCST